MSEQVNIRNKKRKTSLHPAVYILLGYMGVIFTGGILLVLPFSLKSGQHINFPDALFTSASMVFITGLKLFDIYTTFSGFGQAVILLLVQIGGLGFMTLASMLLIALGKRVSLRDRILIKESMNKDDTSEIVKLAKRVFVISLCIETVGAVSLLGVFVPYSETFLLGLWRSVFHSVSAFCNAGADVLGPAGTTQFVLSPLFNILTMLLVTMGGLGIGVLSEAAKFKKEKLAFQSKLVLILSLVLLVSGGLFLLAAEWNNPQTFGELAFGDKVMAAFFHSAALRTSGFATVDYSSMTNAGSALCLILSFIGAAPASCGGGIKITTTFVLLIALCAAIRGKETTVFRGREINRKVIQKAVCIAGVFVLIILLSVLTLSFTESGNGFTLQQIVFECFSALTSSGLDLGVTPLLSGAGKSAMMLLMLLGRAGYLSLAFLFTGKNTHSAHEIKYPDAKITVG